MKVKNLDKYFKSQNFKYGECLYPLERCERKAIKSHSIQNSGTFDLLHSNNHLYSFRTIHNNSKPELELQLIGRNLASTFLGLCKTHDNLLFEPIDKETIDLSNQKQLFLLAYRSILKEFHATIEVFGRFDKYYQQEVKQGYRPRTDPQKEIEYSRLSANTVEMGAFKHEIDLALKEQNYDFMKHEYFIASVAQPSVACSQLFSADSIKYRDDILRIMLNVVPLDEVRTLVLFSSTEGEYTLAKSYWNRCFMGDEHYQKYETSKMIIRNCENFYLKPDFVSKWSEEKKNKILEYYWSALLRDEDIYNTEEYYLFDD
ncbi:MAG: hypothetical protein RIM99_14450 [Cyclobacteriaceae bacterium]